MSTTLVATQVGKYVFTVSNNCSLTNSEDGVEINGLLWAKHNVDKPNTFTAKPEDEGMFYQWNNTVGWSTTDLSVSNPAGSVWSYFWNGNSAMTWGTANNVCPAGWKIPTSAELQRLAAAAGQWTSINGIAGRIFGSGSNTIFLPTAGCRDSWIGGSAISNKGVNGYYWSSVGTTDAIGDLVAAYMMRITKGNNVIDFEKYSRAIAGNIRCVKDIPKDSVTVHPTKKETKTATICSGSSYFFNGKYYNTTGEYTASLKTSFGCDSIVTLKLTVNQAYNTQENKTICSDELPFTFRDTTFKAGTQGGTYVFKRKTKQGCDSIVTLRLTVNPAFYEEESITICENELPFTFRDTTFRTGTQSGVYVLKRKTVLGCNSITTLNLTVHKSYNLKEQAFLCDAALPFTFRDTTFEAGTVSGNYVFKRKTVLGCDSTVTLTLRVNQPDLTEYATICDNKFPFTFRDTTFLRASAKM